MKIQITTDNNIAGREELAEQAKAKVESTLGNLVAGQIRSNRC
jgi:hypothetical protein